MLRKSQTFCFGLPPTILTCWRKRAMSHDVCKVLYSWYWTILIQMSLFWTDGQINRCGCYYVGADQIFNSWFLGLNIIFLTLQKIIGQKNMARKKQILILIDGFNVCVNPMGGCSGVWFTGNVDGGRQLTNLITSAQIMIPSNYII